MKKIYLTGYKCHNLGDDLFFVQIIERYPEVHFIFEDTSDGYYCRLLSPYSNVTILKPVYVSFLSRVINKIMSLFGLEKKDFLFPMLRHKTKMQADAVVVIGGSVFIEPKNSTQRSERLVKLMLDYFGHVPVFYIGANFGPYKSNEYLESSKRRIELCHDVCFRDKFSYNIFSDLHPVRYAPDVLFGFHKKTPSCPEPHSIGISLIDLSNRGSLAQYKEQYLDSIADFLNHNNYSKIVLFDFCEFEKDIKAVNELIEKLMEDKRKVIEIERYNCNPHEFMEVFDGVETIIATRFHAMILSLVMNKITIPISYSKKMNNVVKDMPTSIGIINISDITEQEIKEIIENYQKPNMSEVINLSNAQFKELDNLIRKE